MPAAVIQPAQPRALLRLRGLLLVAHVRGGATQDEVLTMFHLVEELLDQGGASEADVLRPNGRA